ncbi:UNVERIFIED_CONTAM: hypothetical protein RMT77_006482 [Armadillidium vulgare]
MKTFKEGSEATFGIVDYIVFALMLIVSLGIGIYSSFKGKKSPEDFLMGNRDFGIVPVAMSLLTSFVSAISLLGYSGEAYAYGIEMYLFIVGIACGVGVAGVVCLPVLYPLKLTSVNEYIVLRFHSRRLRQVILTASVIQSFLFMGVCLYAPTIALAAVTPISSLTYTFILGVVVTIYSTIGGIRAVIWTDVFQLTVMLLGLLVVVIAGVIDAGGFSYVWETALKGGRLTNFHTNPSIYERHNIYNTFFFGLFLFSSAYGISQINVQRLCAVKSIEDGRKILWINAIGMLVMFVFIFGEGVVAYAAYHGCDPFVKGLITKKEEIIPYFVVDRLNFLIGLPGIFVATIIGGALSSLSSVISATVALIWKDFCCQFKVFSEMKPQTAGLLNKMFSLVIGAIIIGTALIARYATSLIEGSLIISGVFLGPIYGVFLFGFLFPQVNLKGIWCGFFLTSFFIGWMSLGHFFYSKSLEPLPLSAENCPINELFPQMLNTSIGPQYEQSYTFEGYLTYIYDISYTLYPVIGTCLCLSFGFIISFLTGNRNPKEVNPKYITPFMRKFFWTEEEVNNWETVEKNGNIMSRL